MNDMGRCTLVAALVVGLAGSVGFVGCSKDDGEVDPGPSAAPELLATPLPDLSSIRLDAQEAITAEHARLGALVVDDRSLVPVVARTYGELGELYHAYGLLEAARPCYRNARALAPEDFNWAYLLGRVERDLGNPADAIASFVDAGSGRSVYLPAWFRIGEMEMNAGRLSEAVEAYETALRIAPDHPAGLTGLGRIAMIEGDPADARIRFERALEVQPDATSLYALVGEACAALGDAVCVAEAEIEAGDGPVALADPLRDRIDELGTPNGLRRDIAVRLARAGRYDEAVESFRKAIRSRPDDAELYLYLGIMQARSGNPVDAEASYLEAVRLDPDDARIHFALGQLYAGAGNDERAADAYLRALVAEREFAEAHIELGRTYQRSGRHDLAVLPYFEAVRVDPGNSIARFGLALSLIRIERYADARKRLEVDLRAFPDESGFAHLLARLMAAAPQDDVRDGPKALQLAEELARRLQSTAAGETLAMALAENGRFTEAVRVQNDVLEVARANGAPDHIVARLEANRARYESGQPCRVPLDPDDGSFTPAGPAP